MPVYPTLHPAAQGPWKVQNVVDGDTFNLKDKGLKDKFRRVRVIGIDTPELKLEAPFAQEAKDCTHGLIANKEVFLSYGKVDRYGRELAIVNVKVEGGYKCVNEELLRGGLAYYYAPSPIPAIEDVLIAAQKEARNARRGLWGRFHDGDAVATSRGKCYHDPKCKTIAGIRVSRIKYSAALDKGLSPCRACLNPDGNNKTSGGSTSHTTPTAAVAPAAPNNSNSNKPAAAWGNNNNSAASNHQQQGDSQIIGGLATNAAYATHANNRRGGQPASPTADTNNRRVAVSLLPPLPTLTNRRVEASPLLLAATLQRLATADRPQSVPSSPPKRAKRRNGQSVK